MSTSSWWRDAVFYQVYVRSFADSNGDGIGDLAGLHSRLGYLELLGVDALWLNPFYRSPMADSGYDVSNPREVDPVYGTIEHFDALLADAHKRGLKIVIDLVPNHTSVEHEWFKTALVDPQARDRYIFRSGKGKSGDLPPNNWTSVFGGPAWTRISDGQWYLHLFDSSQPDLNWEHADVHADLRTTMRFWLDRGVDGFRIDMANAMAKPANLPDMVHAEPGTGGESGIELPDPRFDNDDVHDIHRMIRAVLDEYPDCTSVGEIWVRDADRFAKYVRPDELHMAFNFRLTQTDFDADAIHTAVSESLTAVATANDSSPASWTLSNHDVRREVTRYGGGELGTSRARAMIMVELALPGVTYIYNGSELGLPEVDLPESALTDPTWERSGHVDKGRDGCRVPLPWEGPAIPFGFSPDGSAGTKRTWLPQPEDWAQLTVEAQLEDTTSMLSLYRQAIEIRKAHEAFAGKEIEWYGAPAGCFAFRRKEGGLICALNTSSAPVPLPPGDVLLASGPLSGVDLPPNTAAWLV